MFNKIVQREGNERVWLVCSINLSTVHPDQMYFSQQAKEPVMIRNCTLLYVVLVKISNTYRWQRKK